ncbi:unnamed protein product, partial [Cuscuta epithymum]
MIKCNFDAAIFPQTRQVGYGIILRDDQGKFIAARNGFLNCHQDPLLAESMACKEALSWLINRGDANVVIETDCLVLKNAVDREDHALSYFERACKLLFNFLFNSHFAHVKRSANVIAHALAQAII